METTGDSRRASPDPAATQAVSAVSFRLPRFWPADPSLWLAQVSSQFVTARLTAQTSKFHHVVSALPPEIASEIRHLILAPPETNPYEKLSAELLKRTSSSERQRLQQLISAEELGDRKPSQLLRRLQQVLGDFLRRFDLVRSGPATRALPTAPTFDRPQGARRCSGLVAGKARAACRLRDGIRLPNHVSDRDHFDNK
ncbi:hypothetical protein HPB52_010578 [Rhipicephalus sanguineus]|uniref:DUF7041 domain-containing protein n=1 Tax=Rhipicephalus sanguineus TaxID=34632 RepID=A0A9D4Q6K8_RHISA|nr:hypothetical protein HPB52_010578 [Rhipicephalus sanguineus]